MFTNIFESRNKTFLNLVKLGDFIGRSLRENVELFSVEDSQVLYLTESGNVISGKFNKSADSISQIKVESSDSFEDRKVFSSMVDKKVNDFIYDIVENDLSNAQDSFDNILNLWESRLHFTKTKSRLSEKASRFDESTKIIESEQFSRLQELKGTLVKFLSENKELAFIPEIRNAMKLSNVIANSFDLPKITVEELQESGVYTIPKKIGNTLYEHLCRQELLCKELLESKKNLQNMWLTNDKVQKLPFLIAEDDDKIMENLADLIYEIPFLALATKKQLSELVENNLDLMLEDKSVSKKEVKEFVGKIFEFKKPVKKYIIDLLNEKYGTNVQNLASTPTFDSLIKTHIVILEVLSKISPKGSNQKRVLHEMSESLKDKSGVEAIDLSTFLNEVFSEAGFSQSLNETSLLNYLNFDQVADDLGKIGHVLKMIKSGVQDAGGQIPQMGGDMGSDMAADDQYDIDGGESGLEDLANKVNPDAEASAAEAEDEFESELEGEDEMGGDEESPMGDEGEEEDEMPMDDEEIGMDDEEEEPEEADKEDLISNLKELEDLINSLKADMGEGEEDSEFDDEEESDFGEEDGEEEFQPEEGEDEDSEEEDEEEEDELEEGKVKGADGKACWDGYKYAGTENGKDKCVPSGKGKKKK